MLLTTVSVENFGPFHGTHTISLAPRFREGSKRPIIVIGGLNGSGKTSFLEAIRLCFHGRRALGNPRNTDYHEHLRNRIHTKSNGPPLRSAKVSLDIEVVEAGTTHCYRVYRSWRNSADVREELRVTRDGAELPEVPRDQLQAFLDELVPLGLSEFFFFDGEHIQKLADDNGNDQVVSESIRGLLGLQVPSRLMTDLEIFVRSNEDANTFSELSGETAAAETALASIRERVAQLNDQISALQSREDSLVRQVDLQEGRISVEGGDLAQKRSSLTQDASKWRSVSQTHAEELRELASGLLPFCLVPELTEAVRKQLVIESDSRHEALSTALLRTKREELLELLTSDDFWMNAAGLQLDRQQRDSVARALSHIVQPVETCSDERIPAYVHDLSEREQRALLVAIGRVLVELPVQASKITESLVQAEQNLKIATDDLARIPNDEALEPLMTQLAQLHKRVDSVVKERKELEEQLRGWSAREQEADRNLRSLTSQIEERRDKSRANTLAMKVQTVLRRYSEELTVARANQLADCVTECCQRLAHKQGLVNRVELDRESLTFSLYDVEGQTIYRPLLSAGEKQILAIALLWGLGRASGREIPIMIDTPLARLDTEHRDRVLTQFFPNASHQVILLATDSEISRRELDLLGPALDRALHFRFDPESECTTVEDGYLPNAGDHHDE